MDTNPFLNESSASRRPSLHSVPSAAGADAGQTGDSVLREALRSGLWIASSVRDAAAAVGGLDVLESLDAEPLPADPLCREAFTASELVLVDAAVALIEAAPLRLYDREFVTIGHRILERVAVNKRELLHKGTPERVAAGVMWLALRGNGAMGQRRGGVTAQVLTEHFGASGADRGQNMYRALGLPAADLRERAWGSPRSDWWLRDRALLHSSTRRDLLEERAGLERLCRNELERAAASRPIRTLGSQVQITGRVVVPSGILPTDDVERGPVVLMMFGGSIRDPDEVLALSATDAQLLADAIEDALQFDVSVPIRAFPA